MYNIQIYRYVFLLLFSYIIHKKAKYNASDSNMLTGPHSIKRLSVSSLEYLFGKSKTSNFNFS